MRRILIASLSVAVLALTAGCANQPGTGPGDLRPDVPDPIADGSSADLIGLWRVSGVEGEAEDTWLRLDRADFQLWRECGMLSGSWVVRGEAVLFSETYGASGECATESIPAVPWLTAATGYRPASDGIELVGASGESVASLAIDGAPEPREDLAAFYTEQPEITEEVQDWLAAPAPLPTGLRPAATDDLVGRWVSADAPNTDAHVEFAADSNWTGSDGCNGNGGRWVLTPDGVIAATGGFSTMIACEGAAIPSWVSSATSAGFDGDSLVLVDAAGDDLGRLVPA